MLYGPAGHQQDQPDDNDYDYDYKHDPYAPPASRQQSQQRHPPPRLPQQPKQSRPQYRGTNDYLPPPTPRHPQPRQQTRQPVVNPDRYSSLYGHTTRSFGSSVEPQHNVVLPQQPLEPPLKLPQYNEYDDDEYNGRRVTSYPQSVEQHSEAIQPTAAPQSRRNPNNNNQRYGITSPSRAHSNEENSENGGATSATLAGNNGGNGNGFPSQAPTFTRVQAGAGSNTQVHAILDYDDDGGEEYYDDENEDAEGGEFDQTQCR